jgi:hypothetical protein
LTKVDIAEEVGRRIEEYTRIAGIETVKILEFLRDALFADPTKILIGSGAMNPAEWPEDVKKLVTGYKAAGVNSLESVQLADRVQLAFKLYELVKGMLSASGPQTVVNAQRMRRKRYLTSVRHKPNSARGDLPLEVVRRIGGPATREHDDDVLVGNPIRAGFNAPLICKA